MASTRTRTHRPKLRRRGDRGVTLVEYVLFIGGFCLVATTAVGGMNTGARSYFSQSSSRIGQPINRIKYDQNGNRQQQASTTTITAPPATTTTLPPTTTTTLPPTTTTTTAAPTTVPVTRATTTVATTTTTAAPRIVYGSVDEWGTLTLTAPAGQRFTAVVFASYGTPTGSYPYTKGWCDASTSGTKVQLAFLNKNSASIDATNDVFGDPCSGTFKRLSVALSY